MLSNAAPLKPIAAQESPQDAKAVEDLPPVALSLLRRLESAEATICVVGMGYVGLPLARALHGAGFRVLGYDVDPAKIEMLNSGKNYLRHLGDSLTKTLAASDRFEATAEASRLAEADAILLCVPTPLGRHREPDLSFVLKSTELVARSLRTGQLVVLESTTYPGTTRDEMLPILEAGGLRCGEDFFVAYSPEREDPGRSDASTESIPKLVGGLDPASTRLAVTLYRKAISQVHEVASAEVAEAAKLLENIYRAVNIALVNELKTVLMEMDIDIWDVIAAASTKPFGFQAFYPGPGLGGHCIPIDPFYLTWKAKEIGHHTKFIELAGEINSHMPRFVVDRVMRALNDHRKALAGSKVMVIGIAYKPNVDDIRESPAAEIIELLQASGAEVSYHDPLVPRFPSMRKHDIDLHSVDLTPEGLAAIDCALIVTNHAVIDYAMLGEHAPLIVDSRDAMRKVGPTRASVMKA